MSTRGGLRAVFRERDFRSLYATRLTSQLSDGIFQVGLANFVFFRPESAPTARDTAAALSALLLPYTLVGPFAGVLIDRWSRQRILLYANLLRAVMVLGVALLVAADVSGVRFYVAALAVLSVNRFLLAALSAALPHVLPDDRLVLGNSVSTTSGTIVAILGGGVGLTVRQVVGKSDAGDAAVMVVAAGTYVLAALAALRMGRSLLGPDHDPDRPETVEALRRVYRGLVDGAQHVWHYRRTAHALLAIAAHRFFYGLSSIATLLLYKNYFEDGRYLRNGLTGLGQLFAASAVGFLVAATITPAVTRRIGTEEWVILCFGAAALAELVFGIPYTKLAMLGAAFFLGLAAQGSKICVDTIVQQSIEDDYRGRVFSFYDIVFNVAFVAAATVGAFTLPPSGKSYPVLVFIAVGYATTAVLYQVAFSRAAWRSPHPAAAPAAPAPGPAAG